MTVRRRALIAIAPLLLAGFAAVTRAGGLKDPRPAPAPGPSTGPAPASPGAPAKPPAGAPDLDDPAFERFLDPRLLARAWDRQDPALLTDAALLLAEGERILLRTHRTFRADQLLEIAAYLAADLEDQATLSRLARAAELRHDSALAALVKQADRLMATPTADRHEWAAEIESLSRHSLSVHQATLRHIRAIRICGDRESLDELKKAIEALPDLAPTQKAHALKAIDDHSKNLEHSNAALRPTIQGLDRLARLHPSPRPAPPEPVARALTGR